MRHIGLVTLAAFLAACTPAGMNVPTPTVPVDVAPAAAPSPMGPPPAAAVGAAATPAVPGGAVAPVAAADEVVIEGVVMAPDGVRAPGADRTLSAVGDRPLANAPVQVRDPKTRKVLGTAQTNGAGQYRLTLTVTVAADKTLIIAVGAIDRKGKPLELTTLARVPKTASAGARVEGADVGPASTMLARHMLAGVAGGEILDPTVVKDFQEALVKLEAALRSDTLESVDLSDPAKVERLLKELVASDKSLGDLVTSLDKKVGTLTTPPRTGGSGGGSSGGGNTDEEATDEEDIVDEEATDEEDASRTPIFSGTIE